jgi:glutamate synthase (ferredoxin)
VISPKSVVRGKASTRQLTGSRAAHCQAQGSKKSSRHLLQKKSQGGFLGLSTGCPRTLHHGQGQGQGHGTKHQQTLDVSLDAGAVDLDELHAERDACGVGFIVSKYGKRTHEIINKACGALGCMEHRGACSADDDSGDGAGLMTEIPWKLLASELGAGVEEGKCGVGMVFLPQDEEGAQKCKDMITKTSEGRGFEVLGWRDVPVNHDVVGVMARDTEPKIAQIVVKGSFADSTELDRELYILRKMIEKEVGKMYGAEDECYICTMSGKTIVYKGMLRSVVVQQYYLDLQSELFETAFAIYHRRFSTNTVPKWPLAQPMRFLGHNGEINTLQGNLNVMNSREKSLQHPLWEDYQDDLLPICKPTGSDSANLDRVAELLIKTGFDVEPTMMLLVPEAYNNHPDLDTKYPEVKSFYKYFEGLQEGWDGPALLVFSDGDKIGARLDRNGLRPARFWETDDGFVYVASEVGVLNDVLEVAPNCVAKGRLGPGQMLCVDMKENTFSTNIDIAKTAASQNPYEEWVKNIKEVNSEDFNYQSAPLMSAEECLEMQFAFGYGIEDSSLIIESMASEGKEATFCMGDTIALPVLSGRPHLLYDYFKQRFAQVTNPPIDPLREGLVMSLAVRIGRRGNLLKPEADSVRQVDLTTPFLKENELEELMNTDFLKAKKFSTGFDPKVGMKKSIEKLCLDIEEAVRSGCEMVVLSDKPEGKLSADKPYMPILLAAGAVNHHLIDCGLRTEASIVTETAQCFSTHHFACLIGFGVSAICPYLALETCRQWRTSSRTENLIKKGRLGNLSVEDCQHNLKVAINKGLMKILSKMGISVLNTYQGAQILEVYGLNQDVMDLAFKGTISRIGGMTLDDLAEETMSFWTKAFPDLPSKLEFFGFITSRPTGEYHAANPEMSKLLHKAVGLGGKNPAIENFKKYQEHQEKAPITTLRDMLEIKSDRSPISIDEVEPATKLVERFCTGGMSLGAISRETHEVIAIAMNRLGGKSNSGEGGEDPIRWTELDDVKDGKSASFDYLKGLQNGDIATSAIKQVASGRFGVTPVFLANASQLEIKVAQGAKPGEGGQLPGKKVSPYIAGLRRSKPGVPLISPPPHHDIYSIEDLAQLIYDLHQVNEQAKVSVKLVSQAGIGTVASGVAKANADVIQISGHDGGTGASPVSSIKHCGGPLELGLAETHISLTQNQLRDRVILRADGGLRNGRDVMMSALLGADEYGFGTLAMIATGCIMARICHTNNCPVGVASQREDLRKKFPGTPSDLVNFFLFIAEEVREELAAMGYKSLDEVIGRGDLLKQRDVDLAKASAFDASFLTQYAGDSGLSSERLAQGTKSNGPQREDDIIANPDFVKAVEKEGQFDIDSEIINVDRAFGGRIGGYVAYRYGDSGFAGSVNINLKGSAGQSFSCFIVSGINLTLEGEANDYVCKGMAGGEVVIRPPSDLGCAPSDSVIVGNTALYGATGGRLFANGRAGERFAVRNSMADAVVEGTGDHCCEYMTGGCVVVLGPCGRNVGAGMTGGLGYFYDEDGSFPSKLNPEIVNMQKVQTSAGELQLKRLISDHHEKTGSPKAKMVLDNWEAELPKFWQIVPPSESNTPEANANVVEEVEEVAVEESVRN